MFDIDKALRDIKIESRQPSERLRESTRQLVDQEIRKKHGAKRSLIWALPVAAALLAACMFLFVLTPAADEVSYITIDINPSVSMKVNGGGTVLSVSAENGDASALLKSVTLTGLRFEEALKAIVQAADAQGYLKDNGHVLVARFGDAAAITQQQVESVVVASTQRSVTVLYLQSSKETFDKAKSLHQKPGVELLKAQAFEQGIKEQNVDDIIDRMAEKEKKNEQNAPRPSEKNESRPTATPNAQGQKDNGGADNENKQDKQRDEDKVKENKSNAADAQDKPSSANEGGQSNGENQTSNAKEKDESDSVDQNNSETGNSGNENKDAKTSMKGDKK